MPATTGDGLSRNAGFLQTALIICAFLVMMAIDAQPIVPVFGTEVRFSASDPLIALAGVLILLLAVHKGIASVFAGFDWRWLAVWGVAVAAWWTVSLFVGHATTGHWSSWALISKYAGLYVLGGYLVFGLWLGAQSLERIERLLAAFIVAGGVIAIAVVLAFLFFGVVNVPRPLLVGADYRAAGLMINPNAYGFLVATVMVIQAADFSAGRIIRRHWHLLFTAAGTTALLLTGSRSAWLAYVLSILAILLLQNLDWRRYAACLACGALVGFAISGGEVNELPPVFQADGYYVLSNKLFSLEHHSVYDRFGQFARAFELWLQHPVFGIGLGAYLQLEHDIGISIPQQIHNTALWLLAETGTLGFLLIVGFFALLLWRLRHGRDADPWSRYRAMIFAILLAFAGFSVGQEGLYQRQLWVFVGIGLMLVYRQYQASNRGQ
jgi:hypothetical protein